MSQNVATYCFQFFCIHAALVDVRAGPCEGDGEQPRSRTFIFRESMAISHFTVTEESSVPANSSFGMPQASCPDEEEMEALFGDVFPGKFEEVPSPGAGASRRLSASLVVGDAFYNFLLSLKNEEVNLEAVAEEFDRVLRFERSGHRAT